MRFAIWISLLGLLLATASCGSNDISWKHNKLVEDFDYEVLTPEDQLPEIISKDGTTVVIKGEDVVIDCNVTNLEKYSLVWQKGRSILWILQGNDENNIQYVTSDSRISRNGTALVISKVEEVDEDDYTCEISSNPQEKMRHRLTVLVPPSAMPLKSMDFIQINEGQLAHFGCQVSGNPLPSVSWERIDNRAMRGKENINNTMTIYNVTSADAGVYACVARNGVGEPAKALMTLNVFYAPTAVAFESIVYGGVGYDAEIGCIVDASPFPRVDWFKNNSPVNPMKTHRGIEKGKRFILYFERIVKEDFGMYFCNASNILGTGSASIEITGRPTRPIITSKPQKFFTGNYSLVWEVESFSTITSYVLSMKTVTEDLRHSSWFNITVHGTKSSSMYHNQQYNFNDLEHNLKYYVKVLAKNEFGPSDFSYVFEFQFFEGIGKIVLEEEKVSPVKTEMNDDILNTTRYNGTEDASSGLSSAEERGRLVSTVTAVSLSCFFSFSAMRL